MKRFIVEITQSSWRNHYTFAMVYIIVADSEENAVKIAEKNFIESGNGLEENEIEQYNIEVNKFDENANVQVVYTDSY